MLRGLVFVVCSISAASYRSLNNNRFQFTQQRLLSMKRVTATEKSPIKEPVETEISPKAKKPKLDRSLFIREELQIQDISQNKYLKICIWNAAGLRTVIKNHESKLALFLETHSPDIVCLQETKLQNEHVKEHEDFFDEYGYKSYWNCSIIKKGYSGVAVLIKKNMIEILHNPDQPIAKKSVQSKLNFGEKSSNTSGSSNTPNISKSSSTSLSSSLTAPLTQILNVSYDAEDSHNNSNHSHKGEGRIITIEFNSFCLVACYVPNSGEGLKRLDYRINEWDPFLRQYLSSLEQTKHKPVILAGDLNVGHLDLDIYNHEAKHIVKQAGLTPQERQSFGELLKTGYVDALRYFYPEAKGQFSYWSKRTSAFDSNSGLRLDYFICSRSMTGTKIEDNNSNSNSSGGNGAVAIADISTDVNDSSATASIDKDGVKPAAKKSVKKKTESTTSADVSATATTSSSSLSSDITSVTTSSISPMARRVMYTDIPTPGLYDYISLHDDPLAQTSDHCPLILVLKL